MANDITFTNLAPIMYSAMDTVAREQVGALTSVLINASGVNETAGTDKVQSLRTTDPVDIASNNVSMTVADLGDKTNVMDEFSLDQFVGKGIPIKGETAKRLSNIGLYGQWVADEFAQIYRSIFNEIESYLCGVVYKSASRAYGIAGTNPFASNIDAIGNLSKILKDNGCPTKDGRISIVMDTTAGSTGIMNLTQLQKVNEAGDSSLLRQGALGIL
jgi:hypothetical protein